MGCIVTGLNVPENIKNVIEKIAQGNVREQVMLLALIESDEFSKYYKEETQNELPKDYVFEKEGINTFEKTLRSAYQKQLENIAFSSNKEQGRITQGFTSEKAMTIAQVYTASKIIEKFYAEIAKASKKKLDNTKLINELINDFTNTLILEFLPAELARTKKSNKVIDDIKESLRKYNEDKALFSEQIEKKNKLKEDLKTNKNLTDEQKIAISEEIKLLTDSIKKAIVNLEKARTNLIADCFNLADITNSIQLKNYANLVKLVRENPNEWFDNVFRSKLLSDVNREFNPLLGNIKTAEENLAEIDNEEVSEELEELNNEALQTGYDREIKTVLKAVNAKIRTYLSSLTQLESNEKVDGKYKADTNNELGVPLNADGTVLMTNVIMRASFYSIEAFIDSVRELSKLKGLESLAQMADDMEKDMMFANECYTELNKPAIKKCIINVIDGNLNFNRSNYNIDLIAKKTWDIVNFYKIIYSDLYLDDEQLETLRNKLNNYSRLGNARIPKKQLSEDVAYIKQLFREYLPNIPEDEIDRCINSKLDTQNNNIKELLNLLLDYIQAAGNTANQIIEHDNKFGKEWYEYENARSMGVEIEAPRNTMPTSIYNNVYEVAKKVAEFITARNITKYNLNSTNADGNTSSDVIYNSYITQILSQVQENFRNKNNELAYVQLNELKSYIEKSDFYRYSEIFYGIPGVKEGLFYKDENGQTKVNPRANEVLDLYLFDGLKDRMNNASSVYATMEDGDYFMCLLSMYANKQTINRDSDLSLAGYMLRVPSDAGKNFVALAQKISISRLISYDKNSINEYLNKQKEILFETIKEQVEVASTENLPSDVNQYYTDITAEQFYEFITEGTLNGESVLSNVNTKETGRGNINKLYLRWQNPLGEYMVIELSGHKVGTKKDYKVNQIKFDKFYTSEVNTIANSFIQDLYNKFRDKGIKERAFVEQVNTEHDFIKSFKQQVLGELNLFMSQLHMMFEEKVITKNKGKKNEYTERIWVLKKDASNLFDFLHYRDGKQNEKEDKFLDENGELIGYAFKFLKLFETQGFKAGEEIAKALSLYGGENSNALLIKDKKYGLKLNINRNDLLDPNSGKENTKFKFIENQEVLSKLDNIVTTWLQNYIKDIDSYTSLYDDFNNNKYDIELMRECFINYALTYMTFDDILEGNSKFYKDAQTFLKRAKEVQMAGTSYAAADYTNLSRDGICDITFKGNPIEFTVGSKKFRVRDGFRAATIYNTVAGSPMADIIEADTKQSILAKGISEEIATKLAKKIADPFRDNTKFNDAQSYITLDEFVRRRHADGTLYKYMDLLEKLYDDSIPASEISVEDMDRIQVQKNVYYDIQYDPISGVYYPRQIKNAEFVLIPKFLAEGSHLRKLHDIMVKNDIGQLNTIETSKAANKNVLTYFSIKEGHLEETAVNPEFEKELTSKNAIETYYYRYLYKQQEVPQHFEDAENKVSIQFMKKLIDNASTSSEKVQKAVKVLSETYAYNIQDSFKTFVDHMGWKIDYKGRILNKEDNEEISDEQIKLNVEEFYEKLAHEAQRLGMDSNFLDYVTLNDKGNPKMPNFNNLVATKFENIIQSVFNNNITRQTIIGWHGAQITNVGHDKNLKYHEAKYKHNETKIEIGEKEFNKLSKEEQANYTLSQQAVIDVLIPRWSKNIPKNITAEELKKLGLNLHIGYRVPTEGKQSIALLNVVGFLDDSQGSTIMVPNEWVTQTGADFDIDSIYGVCPHFYVDRKGKLHKIEFDISETDDAYRRRYIKYVREQVKLGADRISNKEISDKFNEIKEQLLPNSPKSLLRKQIDEITKYTTSILESYENEHLVRSIKDFTYKRKKQDFYKTNEELIEHIKKLQQIKNSKTDALLLQDHIEAIENLMELLDELSGTNDSQYIKENYDKFKKEEVEKFRADYLKDVEEKALSVGLLSFEDFKQLPIELQNTRKQRDNRMIQAMFDILEDVTSHEENYSRSNFDDVIDANNYIKELLGLNKVSRSTYNPIDQIQFYRNAMATRNLKARSVIRDTFLSLCNKAQMHVNDANAVTVIYDEAFGFIEKDVVKEVYGENVLEEKGSKIIIKHNKFGWSNTNRNITGKLLSCYSSETTAHILDAIKEGSLINENEYTFGAFKTLVDLGIDYYTALAILAQPAVTEIVKANSKNASILNKNNHYAVNSAIKEIIRGIDPEFNIYAKNKDIIKYLSENEEFVKTLKALLGKDIESIENSDGTYNLYNIPLKFGQNLLFNRLNGKFNNWAYDIIVAFQFGKLIKFSDKIDALAKCSNPDKFGAKQTVFETRRILDNIDNYRGSKILTTEDGTSFIDALYPLDEQGNIKEFESFYPYLAAFLKYSTIPSVQINSKVLYLEDEKFRVIESTLETNIGKRLNTEQHKRFNKYLVNYAYNSTPYLQYPLTITPNGFIEVDINRINDNEITQDIINKEQFRIRGFKFNNDTLHIEDFDNPTEEDIRDFNKLTPVEKVVFIQTNRKNAGIFDVIHIETIEGKHSVAKGRASYLKYTDNAENPETLYRMFREAFNNKNPLIRLAAIDLIKYAFVVENYEFKVGNISKLIVNSAIRNRIENYGLNLIDVVEQQFDSIKDNLAKNSTFIDNFIRANSDIVPTTKIYKPKDKKNPTITDKIYKKVQNTVNPYFALINNEANREILDYLGVIEIEYDENNKPIANKTDLQYIKLSIYNSKIKTYVDVLYKVVENNGMFGFIPLNKLEPSETGAYSVNDFNNIYPTYEFYKEKFDERSADINALNESKIAYKKEDITTKGKADNSKIFYNENAIMTLQTSENVSLRNGINKLFSAISDHINLPVEESSSKTVILNNNPELAKLEIPRDCIQNVTLKDGTTHSVRINKYTKKHYKTLHFRILNDSNVRMLKVNDKLFTEPELENGTKVSVRSQLYKRLTKVPSNQRQSLIEAIKLLKANENYQAKNLIFYTIEEHSEPVEKKFSTIPLITDDSSAEEIELKAAKELALEINTDITIRSKRGDNKAKKFVDSMNSAGINFGTDSSVESNITDVYQAAIRYYESFAKKLLEDIENFKLSSDNIYDISDLALYQELLENDNTNDFERLLRLILDCKTFGDNLEKIYSLNVSGENNQINTNIKQLINIINSIKNNAKINYANDAIFNEYLAKKMSTNPLVQLGLVKLTDVFDDTSWFDLNIGHISGVGHKQIQNVVNYVYAEIDKARMSVDKKIQEFIKKYEEILAQEGEYREDVIIDKFGRLGVRHNEQFYEDKQKIDQEVSEAKSKYGELSIEYQKARLRKLKWYAENVEQEYIKEYYDKINKNLEFILDKAPDIYLKYLDLNRRIYALKNDYKRLTKAQRSELIQLNSQIKKLIDPFADDEGIPESQLEKYGKDKMVLNQFREEQKKINSTYFVQIEDIDFKNVLKKHLDFIDKYDKHHPYDSLNEKLENEEYRDAYDWIQFNTYYRVDKDSSDKIRKAFNVLGATDAIKVNQGSKSYNELINAVINRADKERPGKVIDEYGIFHPEELTEDEIKQIKEVTEKMYTGKTTATGVGIENEASAVLIKSTSDDTVYKRSVYNVFKKKSNNSEENTRREKRTGQIVAAINKIIAKAVDPVSKNISAKLLFENCTEEEIKKLASLYIELKDIYEDGGNGRSYTWKFRTQGHRYKNSRIFISTKPNMKAYNVEKDYYLSELQNTANGKLWLDIFTEDGNIEHPNLDMFGYFFLHTEKGNSVKKEESEQLVDKVKTEAKQFIKENIEFVEKESYFIAKRKAIAEGRHEEWYEANHYFDPYEHKVKPLKIWTELQIKSSSTLIKPTRVAVNTTLDKDVASNDYKNKNYVQGLTKYKTDTGRYDNGIVYSKKEEDMIEFLHNTIFEYTYGDKARKFFEKGYIPMRRKAPETDAAWIAKQVFGSIGLQADYQKREFYDNISYIYDREVDMDMAHLLRNSDYLEYESVPVNNEEAGTEEYNKMEKTIKEVKERNNEIRKKNAELSASLMDRNIKNIFSDYITKSVVNRAKEQSKNIIYFMQEDLKHREAYKKSRYTGKLIKNKNLSTDINTEYQKIDQENTLKAFENWARRIIYDQYKKGSKLEAVASFMQNVTSAKYMIFNVTGGIANILTGFTNILGESFARDYFDNGELVRAEGKYFSTLLSTLSTMYSNESRDLNSALYKHFDVISTAAVTERREGEKLHEWSDRIQDMLYGFQSGGEHCMQNIVLLAMMESHKLVKDEKGKYHVMTYSQYIDKLEYEALKDAIGEDIKLLSRYNKELVLIANDAELRRKYDELKEHFPTNFIKNYTRETNDKSLMERYLKAKKEKLNKAKETFETFANIYDQYELVNGRAVIKSDSKLTTDMEAKFRNKVLEVNREIHGVYDKISAAKIEAEWWGSLVMQYHKHLYPGFMKRYRLKGYYNELKNSFEKGSYASAVNLLFSEYKDLNKKVKKNIEDNDANLVTASLIEFVKATIDTITNFSLNWEMLPEWEKNNVRKVYGDLCGIASAMLISIGLHMATDDDQIKDSNTLSTILYISDRLFSETMLYTPTGIITETNTLMSNPLAATSSPEDLLKALDIIVNMAFEEDYNPNYTSGLYRGQNKLTVLLKRNIPGYRVYNRLQNMTKNNQYYRINDNSRNIRTSKNIANFLVEEN